MVCGEGTTFRFRNYGNPNTPKTCEDGFSHLKALQDSPYGLTNARMTCAGGGASEANNNKAGNWNKELFCDSDNVITGLNLRREEGHGINNVKIRCGLYKMPGTY